MIIGQPVVDEPTDLNYPVYAGGHFRSISACTDRELARMVRVNNPAMRWLGLALGASLILSACSEQGEPASVTTPSESVSSTAPPSSEEPSTPSTGKRAHNDLRTGHLTRSLKAGDVKLAVEYSLRNRVERWAPGVDQPLTVSMTTVSQSGQALTGRRSICRASPLTLKSQTPLATWTLQTLLSTKLISHQAFL